MCNVQNGKVKRANQKIDEKRRDKKMNNNRERGK